MLKIIPAILTKDVTELQHKLEQLQGLADWVQIDIMDGTLVDNTSITLEDISGVEITKQFFLEAHLMVLHPKHYFAACQKNNIKRVIFHIESGDTQNVLTEAKNFNFQKGIALNPQTPVEKVMPYINQIDIVLLMSVNPGFGGQEFILQTLDKIKALKKLAPQLKIEVDGGINLDNIKMITDAGADYVVMGKGLFETDNLQERFKELISI